MLEKWEFECYSAQLKEISDMFIIPSAAHYFNCINKKVYECLGSLFCVLNSFIDSSKAVGTDLKNDWKSSVRNDS